MRCVAKSVIFTISFERERLSCMVGKKRDLRDKIEYTMLCVKKFAAATQMSAARACAYLYDFKGLDFLDECYEVESTLSPRIMVEDLREVCVRNGGVLT